MTERYGEDMRIFKGIQIVYSGMAHIRGFYLNQRTWRALHQVVIHRKPDRDGPRMTCARIQLVVKSCSMNGSGRDSNYKGTPITKGFGGG